MTHAGETRDALAALFETMRDFVGIAATDGHFLFLNRAARRMVGRGEEEDLSRLQLGDLHPPSAMRILTNEGIPGALKDGPIQTLPKRFQFPVA